MKAKERYQHVLGRSKWELDTPCLVVDLPLLLRNIATMEEHARTHGKKLRPHVKTHKCSAIAGLQREAGCLGFCAAKVSEAEGLLAAGYNDILITSPVVTGQKIERLLDCAARSPELKVVVDNHENAASLNRKAADRGVKLNVLVDLDPGMGRTGIAFDRGVELARAVGRMPSLNLCGIQCYLGSVQHIASYPERKQNSFEWMTKAAAVAREMREEGLPCVIFTGAGTGTYDIDCLIAELTEMQVGSYVFMDVEYLTIGSAGRPHRFERFAPALTLLTSVISVNQPGFVTVDAGLKALYHHGAVPEVVSKTNGELIYDWFGDEQGKVIFTDIAARPALGRVLELIVSHCDPTVNLFDVLFLTSGDLVVDVLDIDLRGKSQ